MKSLGVGHALRNRSGSAASYTTATSDSGDVDSLPSGQSYNSGISSSSPQNTYRSGASSSGSASTFSASPTPQFSYSSSTLLSTISNPASALSPVASRVREQDANAIEAYLRRHRSGSESTDAKGTESSIASPSPATPLGSNAVSSGPSMNGDDLASLQALTRPWQLQVRRDRHCRTVSDLHLPSFGLHRRAIALCRHFQQRMMTRNPRNLRGLRANTLSSQTLQKKIRVRA